ncbi:heterokaryon incompatibility protein-domain-containing protein [Hypoxylon sp. FL1857]|nr:heterokaryon incompatibility protein-domain-containing protein [Hypoxylon sp. FL1857]
MSQAFAAPLSGTSDEPVPWIEETGKSFRYDSLPTEDGSMRLLELEPALSPEDPIRCKLGIHANLNKSHMYEILSCDWRSVTKPQVPISLDGRTLDIPSEIWVALQRVRLPDQPRLLWTDAICINQKFNNQDQITGDAERNSQLSRLRDIYQGATGLLVWLGGAEDNSDLVFEHLDSCRRHTHINWCQYTGKALAASRRLSQRSWFYRVQSAQELALSKKATILCGRRQSAWPEILKCSSFLGTNDYYHPLKSPDGMTHLHHLRKLTCNRRVQLRDIFLWNRHCRADDPRDKVLGVLMMDTGIRFGIPIDHSQDVVRLFQSFTQKIIESTNCLYVLHWFGTTRKRVPGLPSWVPDYSIVNPIGTLPRIFSSSVTYSVHYPFKLISGIEVRPGNILAVKGRFVEKIEKVAGELRPEAMPGTEMFNSILRGWESLALSLSNKRFPQAIIDAFCDTLIGNDEDDLVVEDDKPPYVRESRPLTSRVADEFNAWYKQYGTSVLKKVDSSRATIGFDSREQRERINRHLRWYTPRMENTSYGRSFFISGGGSMGLAAPRAKEGDDIVFFPGSKYPFVLRGRDNGTYELVGDCFLYDFDVFSLLQDQKTITQEFLLA